jgi:site-specific DNA-methyltransferase (adenine-specific)
MIVNEDCIKHLKTIEDNYFDSVVTDPPYHLTFMNKYWDSTGIAFTTELWKEVYRTLKPGGYLLSFAASRNYHRMAVAIEDSGFEIRDQIMWIYGSGFPKSLNIGKQIDKKLGNKRISLGKYKTPDGGQELSTYNNWKDSTVQERRWPEVTKGDSEWEGWGTALKPAHEPICMARKPISEKSVTDNVLKHGTGGINIDGCRVTTDENISNHSRSAESAVSKGIFGASKEQETHQTKGQEKGRYPANLIHDGSDEVVSQFPKTKSSPVGFKNIGWKHSGNTKDKMTPLKYQQEYKDEGSVSRYFYCAKANKKERGDSKHPTVKPVKLMRYLVRLVTPKDGIVLDPFAGTGTTGEACILENRNYYLIEAEESYIEDIENRTNKYGRLGI